MPPEPAEGMPQREILLRLRAAIDTAITYPTWPNINAATTFASEHPRALRSSHVRNNLGRFRWEWLNQRGIYPVGEPIEIAGAAAVKATITPDITK